MTRRVFFASVGALGVARAFDFNKEIENSGVFIRMIPADARETAFLVGVRAKDADLALVEVFYETELDLGSNDAGVKTVKLLLSDESIAIVAGMEGYGATRRNFNIPRESVKFVEVTLLNKVSPPKRFE